eukprot:7241777-Prymnesium_polylepis.1
MRSRCKECGGGSLCLHGRQRSQCAVCGGGARASHAARGRIAVRGRICVPHARIASQCCRRPAPPLQPFSIAGRAAASLHCSRPICRAAAGVNTEGTHRLSGAGCRRVRPAAPAAQAPS